MKSSFAVWSIWVLFVHAGSLGLYWCWRPTTGAINVILRTNDTDLTYRSATGATVAQQKAELAGETSLTLPPGTYELEAKNFGYMPWKTRFEVQAGQTVPCVVELTPLPVAMGRIVARADDVEVQCELTTTDGKQYAAWPFKMPFDQPVPTGKYTFRASKPAYKPFSIELTVLANERCIVKVPRLDPLPGVLVLDVKPSGCTVSLLRTGQSVRNFPRKVTGTFRDDLPPGEYTVTAQHEGYVSGEKSLTIAPDRETEIAITLQVMPFEPRGTLVLDVSPSGSLVSLTGPNESAAPGFPKTLASTFCAELPAGEYRIAATHADCQPSKLTLVIVSNELRQQQIRLIPVPLEKYPVAVVANVPPDRLELRTLGGEVVVSEVKAGLKAELKAPGGHYRLVATKLGMDDITSAEFDLGKRSVPPIDIHFLPKVTPKSNVVLLFFATDDLDNVAHLKQKITALVHGVLAKKGDQIFRKRAWIVYRDGPIVDWNAETPLVPTNENQRYRTDDALCDVFLKSNARATALVNGSVDNPALIYLWPSAQLPSRYQPGNKDKFKDESRPSGLLWFGADFDSDTEKLLNQLFPSNRWITTDERRDPSQALEDMIDKLSPSSSR